MSDVPTGMVFHPAPPMPPEGPIVPREPDPGTPFRAHISWILIAILLSVIVIFNQFPALFARSVPGTTTPPVQTNQPALPPEVVAPDKNDPTLAMGRLMVRLAATMDDPKAPKQAGKSLFPVAFPKDDVAKESFTKRVRIAVIKAELVDASQAAKDLRELADILAVDPSAPPGLADDARTFERIVEGKSEFLTAAQRDSLVARHGYFAELALSHGKPNSDPQRAKLIEGGGRILTFFVSVGVLVLLVIAGAITCFTVALVRLTRRGALTTLPRTRPGGERLFGRFVPPAPGGSVYLETLAAFLFAFVLLKLCMLVAHQALGGSVSDSTFLNIQLGAQWLLVPIAFWPLFRRVPWRDFKAHTGLHAGRGIFREIGSGIFGYLAGLPLVALAFVVVLLSVLLRERLRRAAGLEPKMPDNPIAELLSNASTLQMVFFFILATCWAPLVEELVFRASFFRHLRSRLRVIWAALVATLFFALMHGYELMLLPPVAVLGFNLALVREWRGSIVASMTMHFMHNAGTLTIAIVANQLLFA